MKTTCCDDCGNFIAIDDSCAACICHTPPQEDTLDALVRDVTEVHPRPKSEVRRRILDLISKREGEIVALLEGMKIHKGGYNCGEEGCCKRNVEDERESWNIEDQLNYNQALTDAIRAITKEST